MQRILFIVFFLTNTVVYAQQVMPILSDEDTTDLYNALHTSPSQEQISTDDQAAINDSLTKAGYALKRLKDVINMKKDILWASTLSQRIRDFQDSTFILVSPLMKVQGTGVLIGLVSRVGEINLFNPIDPYVTLYWKIDPVTNLEMPFRLQLQVEHSAMLPDSLFDDIELAIQIYYTGKIYEDVDETEADIVGATIEFLDLLEAKVGDAYAPKYMFRVDGQEYRSGHSMSIYEHAANQTDTVVSIYLIDRKSKATVQTTIDWNGAEVEAYHAFVDKDSIGTHTITATIDSADYVFTLTLIGDDVLNVISQSILSVFEAALVDAMQILVDSAQAREDEYQQHKGTRDDLRKQMIDKHVQVAGAGSAANYTLAYIADSTSFIHEPLPNNIKTHHFLGQYINKAAVAHLARVAFIFAWTNREVLMEFTRDASKRAAFRDAVMNDIGALAAEITMALITAEETTVKEFLVDFIVEKVNATTTAQLATD